MNNKATVKIKQQWLVSKITNGDINFLHDYFKKLKLSYKNKPHSNLIFITDHLMGVVDCLSIPFNQTDIEKLGITWGWITDMEKEKFYGNYWNMVANTILQLFNKNKLAL